MTFEEWRDKYMERITLPMFDADDEEAFQMALHACWTAAQFALNNELGVAGNEAAKVSRRKLAVEWIVEFYNGDPDPDEHVRTVDAIIKECQG